MAACLKLLSLTLLLFLFGRFSYNSINFTSSTVCAYYGHIVEACGNSTILHQDDSDDINAMSAFLEAVNSCVLLVLILSWEKFYALRFSYTILLVGHFWVWFALVIISAAAAMVTHVANSVTNPASSDRRKKFLVGSTIFEITSSALLASAVNFIDRKTVRAWIDQEILVDEKKWRKFIKMLYDMMMLSYVFRHLGLFLYDTALVARSISLSQRKPKHKDWTSFLLVLDVAMRGSFAQFFFAKFFQGRELPEVCFGYTNKQHVATSTSIGQIESLSGSYEDVSSLNIRRRRRNSIA